MSDAQPTAMRVTPGGMAGIKRLFVIFAVGFLASTGAAANSFLLCYMAAMLLLLPAITYAMGRLAIRGVRVTRVAPETVWAGDAVTVSLRVYGGSGALYPLLRVRDELPPALHAAGEAEVQVMAGADGAGADYSATVSRRGVHRIERAVAIGSDPLGLVDFHLPLPGSTTLVALPRPEPIAWPSVAGSERYGAVDMARALALGAGVDPDGARPYEPGDPLRRMHWRATARTGVLNVKEFEEARSLSVLLVVDCGSGQPRASAEDGPFEVQIRAAASLAAAWIGAGAAVGLVAGPDVGHAFAVARGSGHLLAILDALAHAEPTDARPMSEALPALAGLVRSGVTLVVLTSDPSPELAQTHAALSGAGIALQWVFAAASGAAWSVTPAWLAATATAGAAPLRVCSSPGQPLMLEEAARVRRAA